MASCLPLLINANQHHVMRLTSGETAEVLMDAEKPNLAPVVPAQHKEPKPTEVAATPEQAMAAKRPMLIGHLPPQVEMAHEALQQAGFRPLGDVVDLGNHACIECLPPTDVGNQSGNFGVAGRARQALRNRGLHIGPEEINIVEVAGRVLVRVPVRLDPRLAYEPKAEMLTFRPLPGGGIRAETPFSEDALLNMRDALVRCLEDVRILVRNEKTISAADLANKFAGTVLASVANLPQWEEWRKGFVEDVTAKNAALVLLHDTTGLKLSSLEAKLSKIRKNRKVQETDRK